MALPLNRVSPFSYRHKDTKSRRKNNKYILRAFGPFLSRIAGVRDRWLCLGVLYLKSQIPSTPPESRRASKSQINSKSQAPNSKQGPKPD